MGDGTFILLNAGRPWPESAKQIEIRLAILLKILQISHFGTAALARGERYTDGCLHRYFRGIWLIHPGLLRLLPSSQFSSGNLRSIAQARGEKSGKEDYASICV